MANITVQLGENASVFHDMKTGLTITKGQTVELNLQQQMSPKIKAWWWSSGTSSRFTQRSTERRNKI